MNEQMDEVFWGAEGLSLCSRNRSTICLCARDPTHPGKRRGLISYPGAPSCVTWPGSPNISLTNTGLRHLPLIYLHEVLTLK